MTGWIQLHRSLREWEWFTDVNTSHLFIYCLLRANHKDTKWRGIEIGRGQFITSLDTMSKETGLSVMQIRTAIKKLELTKEITSKPTNKNRLITIANYNKYQDHNKQDNKRITSKQQTNNKQVTTDNNENNSNNENNVTTIDDFENFWSAYGRIGNKQKALQSWKKLKGVNYEEIIRGHARYADYCARTEWYDKQHASTWLNNRGWESEWAVQIKEPRRQSSVHDDFTKGIALALSQLDEQQEY